MIRLRVKLFLGVSIIAILACYLFFYYYKGQIKPAAQQATEDVLVEAANLLALTLAETPQSLAHNRVTEAMDDLQSLTINAQIWQKQKRQSNLHVYITNAKGMVVYDSQHDAEGKNYSQWNDVYLTLKGKYGARSSEHEPHSGYSVMYVAAPIKSQGRIIGVVSVGKPIAVLDTFIRLAEKKLKQYAIYILLAALGLTALFAWWFVRDIKRVEAYAMAIATSDHVPMPKVTSQEMTVLLNTIKTLKSELDGKQYIEQYAQSLSHELKSPLAGIKASAEILKEAGHHEETRALFLQTLTQENERAIQLVERLLDLTRLEQMQELHVVPTSLSLLFDELEALFQPKLAFKQLMLQMTADATVAQTTINADALLLKQALINLVDNAIDFSPHAGRILVHAYRHNSELRIEVTDEGEGIPHYAVSRVFERFYSLARPQTGLKSSGLGLAITRQIILLHGGYIEYDAHYTQGARFCIHLPAN